MFTGERARPAARQVLHMVRQRTEIQLAACKVFSRVIKLSEMAITARKAVARTDALPRKAEIRTQRIVHSRNMNREPVLRAYVVVSPTFFKLAHALVLDFKLQRVAEC